MDTQTIELIGRNRLIDELILAELEVAIPLRDRGVDLVAYVDLSSAASRFVAVPIQMKAASRRAFSLDKKYSRISNLLLAYVWELQTPDLTVTYALTYEEALRIAENLGWTKTSSWAKGRCSTSKPSKKLRDLLEPYKMSSLAWRRKLSNVSGIAL